MSLLCSALIIILAGSMVAAGSEKSQMVQKEYTFEAEIVKTVRLNYLLFLPKEYSADSQKKWPLILFLHGAGERGDDLEKVKVHGIPKIVEQQEDFPFIAVLDIP